uniref:PDZ and LIM domain 5b n=1 Tax=Tetraodon nigroviridis TaxID=99883 RepID=H3CUH9_TETNG
MSTNYSVSLAGPAPWGFRLQGGKDFGVPLTISRLTDGGKAARAKMSVGDVILSINGITTDSMNHLEAQNLIKACIDGLSLTLQRYSDEQKSKFVHAVCLHQGEPQEIIKPVPITHTSTCTTYTKPTSHSSPAYNSTARPFGAGSAGVTASLSPEAPKVATIPSASSAFTPAAPSQAPQPPPNPAPAAPPSHRRMASSSPSSSDSSSPARGSGPTSTQPNVPQPSVYNTPINLYSNANACEVAMGQRRGLFEGHGLSEQLNGSKNNKDLFHLKTKCLRLFHKNTLSDASKKRLMEDTEDWHPKTGTSQSRSFRILAQLTGTENEKKHTHTQTQKTLKTKTFSKTAAAPRNSGVTPAAAFKSPTAPEQRSGHLGGPAENKDTYKVVSSSPAPHGHWLCPGGAGPSFGKVASAAPKGQDRPTPQPHPQDLNPLLQRPEHMPASTRTPVCNKCKNVIRGPFLVAMGLSWHPEEFTCAHCNSSLAENGFVEEKGQLYCQHCYGQYFAPSCARCQHKILGHVMNALKQTWHMSCFVCVACQQPIGNSMFHMEDGQPYCEKDYYGLFGTNCHGCDFPIEAGDKFLEALGFTWHDTCFVCAVCSSNLEGQAFFSKKDKPLCKKHAHTVNA